MHNKSLKLARFTRWTASVVAFASQIVCAAFTVVSGAVSQRKVIEIQGVTQQQLENSLPPRPE
jgi:uncharacterized protein YggU (UPF0235/DUF167 family)